MQLTTTGIVLREVKTGESDRILTILTPKLGLISASAKGSQRLKNKLNSATSLFCYSEFTLFEGRTMYIVDEASVKNVFYGVRNTVEGMALAMYMAELCMTLTPTGTEAEAQLKLLLNALFFLSEQKRPVPLIKTIFEMRSLTFAGFMPDILACSDCGRYDGIPFCFDVKNGRLFCDVCAKKRGMVSNIDISALAALRHICLSEDDKLFSFTLADASLRLLDTAVEQYMMFAVDRPLKTLNFYHSVQD